MAKCVVQEAQESDAVRLAPKLRWADKREIVAHSGLSPDHGLMRCYESSDKVWAVYCDDEPIALFGYLKLDDNSANVWLLGSDKILDVRWWWLRESKKWLKVVAQDFERLWAVADVRNKLHTRWFKWLGFEVLSTLITGPYNLPFYHIEYNNKEQLCATS